MNILLVYPRYPDTFWSFKYALKFASKKAFSPPLGLLTVAALLPKTWDHKLVDLNADVLTDEDIQWADYIFLSAMDIQQLSAKEVTKRVKAYGKKIVAGGPLFTMCPAEFEEVDHLVLGEAESVLPNLIEDMKKAECKRSYVASDWPDLTSSPIPEWNLLDLSKYAVMNVQYSRGCPYDCDFCQVILLNGNKTRTKTAIQVLGELDALYGRGWRGVVFFVDDNFIVAPRKLREEVLPALITWNETKGYPFTFLTQASINLADDKELMELMVRAGFDSVFIGIETLEEKSLRECHKFVNERRDSLTAVRKMQALGLRVLGGFIVGFDNDSSRIFKEQIEFIQQSGIVTAMVGLLNPLRGTKLYHRLMHEGRLIREWTGDNTDFSLNFMPRMGYQALLEGYQSILKYIYSPDHFYQRLITFLKNYNPHRKRVRTFQLSYIKPFFHVIWVLGIVGEGRFYYWKAFLWTGLRRPRLLALYMRLAIYGYHFRKVFEEGKKVINPPSVN